jgi:hypothetical protein
MSDLADKFRDADANGKLELMRRALVADDIGPICAAAGIHPEHICIVYWVSEHDPEMIALRKQINPNASDRVEGIYV